MSAQSPPPPTAAERLSEWWKRQRAITKIAIIVGVIFAVTSLVVTTIKSDKSGTAPEPTMASGAHLRHEPAQAASSQSLYIWIPNYADPATANHLINSYPETVITVCTGIMGGVWTPSTDPDYWKYFDICAVNAQLGFADPSGVATDGCVLASSGCKKYTLRH